MAAFVIASRTTLVGTAWTGTAPGLPGTQSISGTIDTPTNISQWVRSSDPGFSANMVEANNDAGGGYNIVIPGLTSGDDLVFDCNSDQAASALDSIVRSTLGGIARPGSAPIYVDIKPTSASRGATNPSLVAACFISSWGPFGGAVGDRAVARLTLSVTGAFAQLTS